MSADQIYSRQEEEENLERMATEGLPSDQIAAQIRQENEDANATRGASERRAAKGIDPWENCLLLYELDHREPAAIIHPDGIVTVPKSGVRVVAHSRSGLHLPAILFGDVPIILHLSCDLCVSPMRHANDKTGPIHE